MSTVSPSRESFHKHSLFLQVHKWLKESVVRNGDRVPSLATVRRLFQAPNSNHRASKRYTGLIKAKPAVHRNDRICGVIHPHRHGCFALMKYVKEWSEMHSEEILFLSTDNKATVSVILAFKNCYKFSIIFCLD